MSTNLPIELQKVKAAGDVTIHLIGSKKDLDAIAEVKELKKKIAERISDEDLVFAVPSAKGLTIIAKLKKETETSYRFQSARALGAKLKKVLNSEKVDAATLVSQTVKPEDALAVLEGIVLANYQFLTYKTGDRAKANPLKKLNVLADKISEADLKELNAIALGTFAARDFVNEPPITLTATEWSKRMEKLGNDTGFKTTVLDKKKIEALRMGGLLGVNKGSVEPPTFNILEWKPKNAKNKKPIVLVGKGVTYDTGGYNIKTVQMAQMKSDMGGGAAVTGAIAAIAANKLPVYVVGLIPATDNRIDGKAIVADDVLTMMSGTKVEVLNTDAEGRLILADALHYAKQYDPELVIDLATLTGAAARVTDYFGIAMCADKTDTTKLKESGERVYERLMEFPMWREFHTAIKSDMADIKNIGGAAGGNITAATFLHHFTDYPWIHLDIAGPSFMNSDVDYRVKGGTGVGVRLLYDFIKNSVA
ncbi:MAG: leucyl aminopeptidase [Flavobacteriales bacterium]|nr:leucyl aminopeptidase [Flavobacteriales bacterium]